jgi:hypothetical protein
VELIPAGTHLVESRVMDEPLSDQIENFKTDSDELEETLEAYDLDADLEQEFDLIDSEFRQLEVTYQSLLNTRRFLYNATS